MDPIVNRIYEGLHIDHNEYDQPENTIRDNLNGIIMDLENGNYQWTNMKGTTYRFAVSYYDKIMAWTWIRQRFFLLTLNSNQNFVRIVELTFDSDGAVSSSSIRWQGDNTKLGLDHLHPIRSMWGFYENEEIQRVYWTDFNKQPRTVNMAGTGLITLEEKFANFFPVIDGSYGKFGLNSIVSGGTCLAGTYFFAWRFFKEGYYTDWSYLTTPIHVTGTPIVDTYDGYQNNQGQEPNENTNKRIRIILEDLDTDYDAIQVASFYSNDFNSAQPGVIFYDGDVTGTYMTIDFIGSENLGTVTIDDLIEISILIEKCKDMRHIKKWNVMSNIVERAELDVSGIHPDKKNNQMNVNIVPFSYNIPLDRTGYPTGGSWTAGNKALYGIKTGYTERTTLMHNVWYRAGGSGCTYTDDNDTYVMAAQELFKPYAVSAEATIGAGDCYQAIVIRNYKKASAGPTPDINSDYDTTIYEIYHDFYNYKNPLVNAFLKGYPSEELIRLGILFLDLTGRPFFVRWLNNQDATYGQPDNGDTRTPAREQLTEWDIIHCREDLGSGVFARVSGTIIGLQVSGIDITTIRDRIGGFMIVRAPIVRENIATGVLCNLLQDVNDIYQYPGFVRRDVGDTAKYEGAYAFYCPEDIYQLRDFSIQPGDKLVNHRYFRPFDPSATAQTGCQGYGDEEMDGTEGDFSFYQKFYINNTTGDPDTNGDIGVEHEILFYTRHEQGDTDAITSLPFDPRDPTKELKGLSAAIITATPNPRWSFNTQLGIAVLDIDESVDGNKGYTNLVESDPRLLVCQVKRENNSPYGGTGDSALANTNYIGTGHFQKIDAAVLADIESGGTYIFNDIDVFGGDTFVCLFDLMRLMQNDAQEGSLDMFNHSIIVPMETRINLDLREGYHVGRDRSYDGTNNPGGLRWNTPTIGSLWEDFNYNDGYSSENIQDYYLPLPYNFQLTNAFDMRLRFTETKTYGELEDSFREFPALNILDLDTHFGPVNNIRRKFNRLVYWQRDAVGYIPINERALTQNVLGDPVQLGVGGIFERHDEVIEMIGNVNQLGLAESPIGFHWYDSIRKIYLTLTSSMKFTNESIAKGLDRFFTNDVPNNMDEYDNPANDYGIVSGYNPRYKVVFVTFFYPTGDEATISFNTKNNRFIGFYQFYPRMYFEYKDWMYAVDATKSSIYQHDINDYRGRFYGVPRSSSFTIIVKDKSRAAMIFDRWEIIANNNFFESITYENTEQSIVENINGNRNAKFRNRRWYGNFPKVTRERLVDGYMKITFTTPAGYNEVTFNEMITFIRKMI